MKINQFEIILESGKVVNDFKYVITNKKDYEETQANIDKRAKFFGEPGSKNSKWNNPKYKESVKRYEKIALALLSYEIENDMLPI